MMRIVVSRLHRARLTSTHRGYFCLTPTNFRRFSNVTECKHIVDLKNNEAIDPQGDFFEKSKRSVFRYGLGEFVPNFRSVSFFVLQGAGNTQTHTQINMQADIGIFPTIPAARLTWI